MSAVPVRPQRPLAGPAVARSLPASAPSVDAPPRRHLRAVSAPDRARSLAPLAWTCILLVLTSMAAVLFITTAMAEGAYERRDLRIELSELHQQRAALVAQLEANASPRFLAERASSLGMEPHSTLGFVSIERGAVLEQGGR